MQRARTVGAQLQRPPALGQVKQAAHDVSPAIRLPVVVPPRLMHLQGAAGQQQVGSLVCCGAQQGKVRRAQRTPGQQGHEAARLRSLRGQQPAAQLARVSSQQPSSTLGKLRDNPCLPPAPGLQAAADPPCCPPCCGSRSHAHPPPPVPAALPGGWPTQPCGCRTHMGGGVGGGSCSREARRARMQPAGKRHAMLMHATPQPVPGWHPAARPGWRAAGPCRGLHLAAPLGPSRSMRTSKYHVPLCAPCVARTCGSSRGGGGRQAAAWQTARGWNGKGSGRRPI